MKLLPPVLHGPLYPESTQIFIEPVVEGAGITVFTNNTIIYEGPRTFGGWLALQKPVEQGQEVYARIKVGNDESLASLKPVTVVKQAPHLSAPEFLSIINNYSALVGFGKLHIGAQLEVFNQSTGELVARVPVERTFQYVKLDLNIPIDNTRYLTARQIVNDQISEQSTSPLLLDISEKIKMKTLAPLGVIDPGLTACRTNLALMGVQGLEVAVENEGFVTNYLINDIPYMVNDCQPLKEGKLFVTQQIERIGLTGTSMEYIVGPPATPPKPTIIAPYCPQIENVTANNLIPGATITVYAWNRAEGNWVVVGVAPANNFQQDIPVPQAMIKNLNIPVDQSLKIAVGQDLCGVMGELSDAEGIGPFGPRRIPEFKDPVIDCAKFVILTNTTAGSEIMLYDQEGISLLAKPYYPVGDFSLIYLCRPVHKGETIGGQCRFCDGSVEIPEVAVIFPEQIETVLAPIKPNRYIKFRNCVVGSRIDIYRRKHGRLEVFLQYTYPLFKEWGIIADTELDDEFYFLVFVCNTAVAKGAQTVRKGKLKVFATPATVESGKLATVTIEAFDEDDGEMVYANIYQNPPDKPNDWNVKTNERYSFQVPKERTQPYSGIVRSSYYSDAAYNIAVTAPPEPSPQLNPAIFAQFRLNGADNMFINTFQLSLSGKSFPANTPVRIQYEYGYLRSDGINKYRDTAIADLGNATVNSSGEFSFTTNIELALMDPETGMVVNQGITIMVTTGPNIYHAEFRKALSQGDEVYLDKIF